MTSRPDPVDPGTTAAAAPVRPPDPEVAQAAAARVAALATPPGALGRFGDLAAWYAACAGSCPPPEVHPVRAVVFAGDHGVAAHGVSAFPSSVTPLMVRTLHEGRAGVSALAAAHDVAVRVLDLGVDDDLAGLPPEVTAAKVTRGSRPLHLEDALTADEVHAALAVGDRVAAEEVAAGARLLVSGDLGIGNTTAAAALVAATLGLPAAEVTGTGTGLDADGLAHKTDVVAQALARVQGRAPAAGGDAPGTATDTLQALGGADLAAAAGFLAGAARRGVPVLLDGLMAGCCAVLADRLAPGAAAWFAAGHRSTEPAQAPVLKALGLEPLLDAGMRLGEGAGAVAAVPLVRSAVALLRDTALLEDVMAGG